jgi:hypothetical protein
MSSYPLRTLARRVSAGNMSAAAPQGKRAQCRYRGAAGLTAAMPIP